ncbi:hypothetical protein HBI38_219950 [Parastagonospora nodorum]|nr:hypothetical protein HBI41_186070 [Parastagonospora nodorum]KAH6301013.1 hypothetical protein HBI38_219950 [Parastagonospora nodorum]
MTYDKPRSSETIDQSSYTTPMVDSSGLSSPTLSDDSIPTLRLTPESEGSAELVVDWDTHKPLEYSSTESQASVEVVDDWDAQAHADSPTPTSPTSSTNPDSPDGVQSTASIDMVSVTIDDAKKLKAFNVFVPTLAKLPPLLDDFIARVVRKPRTPTDPPSPAAAMLYRQQPMASRAGESGGIELLVQHLLFAGEAQGGERYIHRDAQATLSAKYLPEPPTPEVRNAFKSLSTSVCDHAIGYVTSECAVNGEVSSVFTAAEEVNMDVYLPSVTSMVHFPFLTCEWKSYIAAEDHAQAELQCARGSSAIVNFNHQFFVGASCTPSAVDTCHFSITCNMNTVHLYVHWRAPTWKDGQYHMQRIGQQFLKDLYHPENPGMAEFRGQLRNVLEWALDKRLSNIKLAMENIGAGDVRSNKRQKSTDLWLP